MCRLAGFAASAGAVALGVVSAPGPDVAAVGAALAPGRGRFFEGNALASPDANVDDHVLDGVLHALTLALAVSFDLGALSVRSFA